MSYVKERALHFGVSPRLNSRPTSDLLVLFATQSKDKVQLSECPKEWKTQVQSLIDSGDFKGKANEVAFVYGNAPTEKRLAIVGLGDEKKVNEEVISHAYAKLGQELSKKKVTTLCCLVPPSDGIATTYGLLHSDYLFTSHKGKQKEEEPATSLKKITFVGLRENMLPELEKVKVICDGIDLTRNLVNTNADEMTPAHLGEIAKEIATKGKNLKADVYGKKWIEKEKMGLLLAVNRGSVNNDPAFIVLEYKGVPKSKEHTVLVGKGITYDTGGLNLKSSGMETMKADMSGAAIVLSTVLTAARLKLPINVTAVVASTENAIGPQSFKPGDVYTSYSGKTVEIGNTDAEGRLILADAIAWTEKNLKPTRIVDLATLTGSIAIALGTSCAGLFTPDDKLANQLLDASKKSFEKLWRMPLVEEYKEQLKSYVADTNNVGQREGGSITASLFIQQFVDKTPWAHLDIAGVAFTKHPQGVYPKNATGYGVRLMTEFLESLT